MSAGRGVTPPFNPATYRGGPPEILALVRQIEETLAAPIAGENVSGTTTEYVPTADNLDSFVIRKGESSARVLGMESFKDNMVVSFVNSEGNTEKAEFSSQELIEVVQNRNRALTQLESFLQQQIDEGKVTPDRKQKLEEILSSVSQYQSSMMHGIDRQLKLSEKLVGSA